MPEIRNLGPKEKITEPGFYRMPLEQHHSQPCDGPSVTSSVLRTLEKGTPGDVWWTHMLNPKRYVETKEKPAFKLGRAMHAWVEGGEDVLRRDFIVLPKNAPKRPSKAQWEAANPSAPSVVAMTFWEKIYERQEKTGRAILSEQEFEGIKIMAEALMRDETATAVIGGEPEITMAIFDEETQLWALSRLDNMTFDGLLSDYKKMSSKGGIFDARLVHRRIFEHGYYQQLALGAEAYHELVGEWPTDCAIVAQMDSIPYHCITTPFDHDALYWGMCQNHRSMRIFRQCLDSGYWPGPGDEMQTFKFTDFQREAAEKRQSDGDLPNLSPMK